MTIAMTRFDIQRTRFLRHDAHRFVRHDAQRFLRPACKHLLPPGSDPLDFFRLLEGKANFNPNQPRVPKGNPDGGQWTSEGGGGGGEIEWEEEEDFTDGSGADDNEEEENEQEGEEEGDDGEFNDEFSSAARKPGIGHNQGPPLDPSDLPKEPPPTTQERNAYSRQVARAIGTAGQRAGAWLAAVEAIRWFDQEQRASLLSYQDPPKSREELHNAVSDTSEPGYHDHHIVEQSAGRGGEKYGINKARIWSRENIVRIPRWKHQDISDWYSTKNFDPKFGGKTSRDYLRDKSWEERMELGLDALKKFGVLKP